MHCLQFVTAGGKQVKCLSRCTECLRVQFERRENVADLRIRSEFKIAMCTGNLLDLTYRQLSNSSVHGFRHLSRQKRFHRVKL